ncbi:MAG: murein biosynthesis integral membrane protein MurJ [Thermoanaerobaculia bacterium]
MEPGETGGGDRGASKVAAGILASRGAGLVREVLIARFLGVGPFADVFRTALRGPNLIQNLLGEQTLSAAFIPVYSRMVEAKAEEDSARFAGAMFGLLAAVAAVLVLAGELLAEPFVALLASGYLGDAAAVVAGEATVDRFPLAVEAIRWIFPMTGLLVLSAWSLAILNSHRRFFLPYVAPVLWNASIVAALWWAGTRWAGVDPVGGGGLDPRGRIVIAACIGALVGGLLQFLVQLPAVLRLLDSFRPSFDWKARGIREAVGAFTPLLAGRGALQLSSFLDHWLASFLRAGAQSALGFAQGLYLLPVALFGMSVAAAGLPEYAREVHEAGVPGLSDRLAAAVRQSSYLTLPAAIGYLAVGWLVVAALFERGSFGLEDTWLVYLLLAAYAVGLPASVVTRQINTVFYAAGKTRRPARVAVERILVSAVLGSVAMVWLDGFRVGALLGLAGDQPLYLGGLGLALGAAVGAWFELARMRRALRREWPEIALPARALAAMAGLAAAAAIPAAGVWWLLRGRPHALALAAVLTVYGSVYFALCRMSGLSELAAWVGRLRRRRG